MLIVVEIDEFTSTLSLVPASRIILSNVVQPNVYSLPQYDLDILKGHALLFLVGGYNIESYTSPYCMIFNLMQLNNSAINFELLILYKELYH